MTVIRGAISIDSDSEEDISSGVIELFSSVMEHNNPKKIIAIFASQTRDLTSFNCCTALRLNFSLSCAFECFQEAYIRNQIPRIIRLSVFCDGDFTPSNIYLKNATQLRPDLFTSSVASN